jgi:hypothetical protein
MQLRWFMSNAAILGTKSEVLDCLLKSEMQGNSSVPSVTLQSEEEVELMCLLLKFCYCEDAIGEVAAHIEKLLALLMLADKFGVSACVQACVKILDEKSLNLEDASILLSLPDSLLQQKCLLPLLKRSRKTIEKELVNLDELFDTEQYLLPSLNVLRIALESSKTRVHSENTVFCLVWGWVGKNCHGASARKAALEELLPLLRFGHMTGDFLLSISEQPELATPLAEKLIKEALRFRMGRKEPGSFGLSRISRRPRNLGSRGFTVAKSELLRPEEGEVGNFGPIIDGYAFWLRMHRFGAGSFQFALHLQGWSQLQGPEDKVSLKTKVWFGYGASWTQVWADRGAGCNRAWTLLIADGKVTDPNSDKDWSCDSDPDQSDSELDWGLGILQIELSAEWST